MTETTIGRRALTHETAGIGGEAVEYILSHPKEITDDAEIAKYARSKVSDQGSSLTVVEMEALARSLARLSALFKSQTYAMPSVGFREYWPVGGENQIAVLRGGTLQRLEQPMFEPRKVNTTPVTIVAGIALNTHGMPGAITSFVSPGRLGLFLKMTFVGPVYLDRGYYFEDDFRNGTLPYDGDVLGFDPSNRVIDCILSLGPQVDRKSPAVQELIARFPWKAVQ